MAYLMVTLTCVGFMSACSSTTDLSNIPPYKAYAGKRVFLVKGMPLEYDFRGGKPSKVVRAGAPITIQRVFLKKTNIHGPIIPASDVSTQIFAVVEYIDPVTRTQATWNYPLGLKTTPYGYAEQIIAAPWEPASTPPVRYVGKDGKSYKG